MSHFSVLVVGDNWQEQLAPFQENNMNDCPQEYLEFTDLTEEYQKQYSQDTTARFESPTGERFSKYDDRFKVPDPDSPFPGLGNKFVCPEGWTEIESPIAEEYPTFKSYMEDYHGYKYDDTQGGYGYWENPEAKWDWYQMGGRWSGYLKTHNPELGQVGESGLMDSHENRGPGWVDQARLKDIDFEYIQSKKAREASELYRNVEALFEGTIPVIETSWEDMLKREDIEIDEKRDLYHAQPALKRMKELGKKHWQDKEHPCHNFLVWGDLADFQCTHDEYVARKQGQAVPTFALLMGGKWYEKGEMGWWGMAHNEKDPGAWEKEFGKLLLDLPGDTLLTVVDCHI